MVLLICRNYSVGNIKNFNRNTVINCYGYFFRGLSLGSVIFAKRQHLSRCSRSKWITWRKRTWWTRCRFLRQGQRPGCNHSRGYHTILRVGSSLRPEHDRTRGRCQVRRNISRETRSRTYRFEKRASKMSKVARRLNMVLSAKVPACFRSRRIPPDGMPGEITVMQISLLKPLPVLQMNGWLCLRSTNGWCRIFHISGRREKATVAPDGRLVYIYIFDSIIIFF